MSTPLLFPSLPTLSPPPISYLSVWSRNPRRLPPHQHSPLDSGKAFKNTFNSLSPPPATSAFPRSSIEPVFSLRSPPPPGPPFAQSPSLLIDLLPSISPCSLPTPFFRSSPIYTPLLPPFPSPSIPLKGRTLSFPHAHFLSSFSLSSL